MSRYVIDFDRIGRNRDAPSLVCAASDADDLANKVRAHVRPHLASRDVEVSVDLEAMTVSIFCGFNNGGSGKISELLIDGQSVKVPEEIAGHVEQAGAQQR